MCFPCLFMATRQRKCQQLFYWINRHSKKVAGRGKTKFGSSLSPSLSLSLSLSLSRLFTIYLSSSVYFWSIHLRPFIINLSFFLSFFLRLSIINQSILFCLLSIYLSINLSLAGIHGWLVVSIYLSKSVHFSINLSFLIYFCLCRYLWYTNRSPFPGQKKKIASFN